MEGQKGDQDRDSNARERQQLSVAVVRTGDRHRQCSSRAEPCSVLAAASFCLPGQGKPCCLPEPAAPCWKHIRHSWLIPLSSRVLLGILFFPFSLLTQERG